MPIDSCSFRLLDDTLTSMKIDIIEGLNIGILGSVHLMTQFGTEGNNRQHTDKHM